MWITDTETGDCRRPSQKG